MKFVNASVVVVSESNNPRLLNPDFLARNGITPSDWQVEDTMVIPPLARVVYTNGIEVILEEKKFQVRANKLSKVKWQTELPRISNTFLNTLPHVVYRSVGLNFLVVAEDAVQGEKDESFLDFVVKDGPWLKFGDEAHAEIVKLQYQLTGVILNLMMERVVTAVSGGKIKREVKFDANFHNDFEPDENAQRGDYINSLSDRYDQLTTFLETLPVPK